MKRILNSYFLTLFAFLICTPGAMALDEIQPPASDPTVLGADHYLELTVSENRADEVQVLFTELGSESELQLEELLESTLQVSFFQELLINENVVKSQLNIPFSLRKDGDAFIVKLKEPDVFGIYQSELVVHLDGDIKPLDVDHESEIVLVAPEGSLAVIHEPADENAEVDAPIVISEKAKGFFQNGEVAIRFVVVPAEDQDNEDNGDDQGGLNENDLPGSASGGCSLMTSMAGTSSAGGMFALALALLGGLRFRRNR